MSAEPYAVLVRFGAFFTPRGFLVGILGRARFGGAVGAL